MIFLYNAAHHPQLDGFGAGRGGPRRPGRTGDGDHHKILPHADQQVDHPQMGLLGAQCALDGVVQRVGKKGVQVASFKPAQMAAVCHSIQLNLAGLAVLTSLALCLSLW